MGTAVEWVDPLHVLEPNLLQHLLHRTRSCSDLADDALRSFREKGRVDVRRREQLLDELSVLAGEAIGGLRGEPRELFSRRLPPEGAAGGQQRRQQLREDLLAERAPVHRDEQESDEGELLAELFWTAAISRIHDEATDLGRSVVVVPDRKNLVTKVPIERSGIVLALGNFVESVLAFVGSVLGETQAGSGDLAGERILQHKEVLALPGFFEPSAEAFQRFFDQRLEGFFVIRQIVGVQ